MSIQPEIHCIILIRENCEACKKLLTSKLFNNAKWIIRHIPIIDIKLAKELFPHFVHKATKVVVDELGFSKAIIATPLLICRDIDQPILLDFKDEAELKEKIEQIRTILTVSELRTGKQTYKAIGVTAREIETREKPRRTTRQRTRT